jgi:hypothetical protein
MQGDFEWLEVAANIAAIITALVATFAYGRFLWERRNKRLRLETCLKNDQHQGGRSLLDLATTLGMTDRKSWMPPFAANVSAGPLLRSCMGRLQKCY